MYTGKNISGRPMFDLDFSCDDSDVTLTFGASFKGELVLIVDVLVLRDLTINITKDSSETKPNMSGAAAISDEEDELLVLHVDGIISSSGDTSLDLSTTGP